MPKICPSCNQTYSDDYEFCLNDGSFLNLQEGETIIYENFDEFTKPRIDWKNINTIEVFPSEIRSSYPQEMKRSSLLNEKTQMLNKRDKKRKHEDTITSAKNFWKAEDSHIDSKGNIYRNPPPCLTITREIIFDRDEISTHLTPTEVDEFSPPDIRLKIGAVVFSQFHVEEKVARGGFGEIYLVTDEKDFLKHLIVMKIIPSERISLMKSPKSTYKEWRVISEYYPDQFVRLLNVRNDLILGGEQFFCIFMEYMEGGSLLELIKEWDIEKNSLSPSQINQLLIYFRQICESVYVLHKEQLLHRDIKPGNVLFDKKKEKCKLCDFEIMHNMQSRELPTPAGTPHFMAPEAFENPSIASDIFSLGATFYYCLSGRYAYNNLPKLNQNELINYESPKSLLEFNSLIPPELDQLILRCLDKNPDDRPANVKEILSDLSRIGNFENAKINKFPLSSSAPLILSKYLIQILPKEDLAFVVKRLKNSGYRSKRDTEHEESDLIEEYCYSVEPDKILQDNLTTRQLLNMAELLEIVGHENGTREEIIQNILLELGFLRGFRDVPGLGATRAFLENSFNNFTNASTSNECQGMIQSAFSSMEIGIDLLIRFYGQIFHGASFETILSRHVNGKPKASRWTFGEKVKVLKTLYNSDISHLPERTRGAFKEKFFDKKVFELLERLSKIRNSLAHQTELKGFSELRKIGQDFFNVALETIQLITESKNVPRTVQIVSIEYDVFGRHFYYGLDDKGRREKIFHPLPLYLGEIYLFFPLTNPARINPLIVPYEYDKKRK